MAGPHNVILRVYGSSSFVCCPVINGEKAAYCTPTFAEKRERTLGLLLKGFGEEYCHEVRR